MSVESRSQSVRHVDDVQRPTVTKQNADGSSFFAHPQAIVESPHIGRGTRIWAFAHVLPGARIGADCNICDGVFVENDVIVGDRVTIKCGVQLWDGVTLEDDVFIGPNATFTNDPFPRSRRHLEHFPKTLVRRGASIGANATLLPGLTIGEDSLVGAGAVVLRDVPSRAVVVGNPARVVGDVRERTAGADGQVSVAGEKRRPVTVDLPVLTDDRGSLTFGQVGDHLPFTPRRYFAIMDVPSGKTRGAHAHREVEQFFVCLRGACTVVLDDGRAKTSITLDSPRRGLHVPPMHWNELVEFTADAVVLCLASGEYVAAEYITEYDEFLTATGKLA
jgi:acetyltransferase-like isoleucine patch superfamily enzyme/dTDP-4-dehydrorhamnose 3,5-epimerase-like enzyme